MLGLIFALVSFFVVYAKNTQQKNITLISRKKHVRESPFKYDYCRTYVGHDTGCRETPNGEDLNVHECMCLCEKYDSQHSEENSESNNGHDENYNVQKNVTLFVEKNPDPIFYRWLRFSNCKLYMGHDTGCYDLIDNDLLGASSVLDAYLYVCDCKCKKVQYEPVKWCFQTHIDEDKDDAFERWMNDFSEQFE